MTLFDDSHILLTTRRQNDHHLDGQSAVATNGSAVVAIPCTEPALPPTWRVVPVWPAKMLKGDSAEIPTALGVHAVRTSEDRILTVEIIDTEKPFPDWRRVMPSDVKNYQCFNANLLHDVIKAAGLLGEKYLYLGVEPDGLGPVMVKSARGTVVIMPARKD